MSIEDTLDRLATNVALLTGAVATLAESVNGAYAGKPIYQGAPDTVIPVAPAPAPETPAPAAAPRGRGRPPGSKTATADVAPVAPAAPATDPLDLPAAAPPAELTAADVRAALVAYQTRSTPEKARAILKTIGKADTLPALDKSLFGAVIAAANAAK